MIAAPTRKIGAYAVGADSIRPVQGLPRVYAFLCLYRLLLRGRRGDACECRLWRKKRAKRSGGIKAIGKRASPAQTEPLIQQNMSPPYRA